MLYPGGGYPGLYYPLTAVFDQPSDQTVVLVVEIPMLVVTGATTRVVAIQRTVTIPMAVAPQAEVPMTRGMAERAELPMRVPTRAVFASSAVGAAISMRLNTGGVTSPARLARTTTIPMPLATSVELPMPQGIATRLELPMRVITETTVEIH